ncbi:MAG TPA: ATP-binding protein [Candidatus Tectomicrobia bacterium]|nr:ATP-binding protein [Candidatus Tectomicrobia bacterium]
MGFGKALQSGLAIRLTFILLAMTAIGMAVMGLYVTRALETPLMEYLTTSLVRDAQLIHDAILPYVIQGTPISATQELAQKYGPMFGPEARVTIIGADGVVLGDSGFDFSEVRRMANQQDLPEVRAALTGGIGNDLRRGQNRQRDILHIAIPLAEPTQVRGALRISLPLTAVSKAATSVHQTVALGALLAFAVVLAVGLFLSRRVTRPVTEMQSIARWMAEGDFAQRVPIAGTDEIAELGRTLNLMAERLSEKIQDLEGERTKVAAILDSMVEGVIAIDQRGRILLMNHAARWIFDLGREQVEGRPLLAIIRHKAVLDLVVGGPQAATDAARRREIELGPPVDRILDAHASAMALAPSGRGTLLVLHDVTELRRLERVRTEFVANVSHELRTPLTSIRGYLETLLDGALEEPANARRFLDIAHTHAERLSRLVDDLLQLSDIETGKLVLKPAPLVLYDVAADVVAFFEKQATQKNLTLRNQVPLDLRTHADWDRLTQILVNLVDNAVKYTPERGQITLGASSGAKGLVNVWVADTGIGIPSTDLPRITERFYRVDKARSRELGGTGLGLAIVKHLVQAHGGELWLESELGKGTTVYFSLPRA